jgi:hypothetical protein
MLSPINLYLFSATKETQFESPPKASNYAIMHGTPLSSSEQISAAGSSASADNSNSPKNTHHHPTSTWTSTLQLQPRLPKYKKPSFANPAKSSGY